MAAKLTTMVVCWGVLGRGKKKEVLERWGWSGEGGLLPLDQVLGRMMVIQYS